MNYQKRIVVDPKIMVGKPVIKGARITVELILKLLAQGVTIDELISQKYYPHLQKSDVYAAIEYAKELVSEERVYPLNSNEASYRWKYFYNQQLPHKGIVLLRLIDETNANKIKVISGLFKNYKDQLKNKFAVVTEAKIRIRTPKQSLAWKGGFVTGVKCIKFIGFECL